MVINDQFKTPYEEANIRVASEQIFSSFNNFKLFELHEE